VVRPPSPTAVRPVPGVLPGRSGGESCGLRGARPGFSSLSCDEIARTRSGHIAITT
jgi:hypothetical protein